MRRNPGGVGPRGTGGRTGRGWRAWREAEALVVWRFRSVVWPFR